MPPSSRPPLSGFLIVLLAATLFGALGPLSRFAYDAGLEPVPFVAWRALLGMLGTGAFVAWRVRRGGQRLISPRSLTRTEATTLTIACICGATLNVAMFVAFDRVTIALALLVFYTYPAIVAGLDIAAGRERLDRTKWIALGLALGGMIAVVASQIGPAGEVRLDALGIALALVAALAQTIFIAASRDGYHRIPADQASTAIIGAACVIAVGLALVTGNGPSLLVPFSEPSLWPLLLFAGIFAAAISSICFLVGIRVIGGTRAGIVMLFEPVVGVALAAVLLGEDLQPIQVAGGAAILVAAVMLQRTRPLGDDAALPPPGTLEQADPVEQEALVLHVPGGP